MQVGVGKYSDKSVALVVLKKSEYVKWLLENPGISGQLAKVKTEAGRLISIFDAKPIKKNCGGHNCQNQAVRFSAYHGGQVDLYAWCDTCDECQAGAGRSKLSIVKTYMEALEHIDLYFDSRKTDYQQIIRNIASAKGLSARCGEKQAEAFFV